MTSARDEEGIIGTAVKRDETQGLGLFDQMGLPSVPPVPSLAMQSGREMAKVEADRTLPVRQQRIVAVLTAYGPQHRFQLHELTGMAENSVNSACNALLVKGAIMHHHYDTASKREVLCLTPAVPPAEEGTP